VVSLRFTLQRIPEAKLRRSDSLQLAAILLALMFFSGAPLSRSRAQTLKGTILGTITDSSRAVIPSAQVLLTEVGTNFRRTEITNDSGFYVFANLDPGNYNDGAKII